MTPSLNGIDDHSNGSASATPVLITDATGDGQVNGIIDDVITGSSRTPTIAMSSATSPLSRPDDLPRHPAEREQPARTNIQIFDAANGAVPRRRSAGQTARWSPSPNRATSTTSSSTATPAARCVSPHCRRPGHHRRPRFRDAESGGQFCSRAVLPAQRRQQRHREPPTIRTSSSTPRRRTRRRRSGRLARRHARFPFVPGLRGLQRPRRLDDGQPSPAQISFNNDGPNDGVDSVATFSTTPAARTCYIVVSGLDLNVDRGRFQVQVKVSRPTTANFSDFPLGRRSPSRSTRWPRWA